MSTRARHISAVVALAAASVTVAAALAAVVEDGRIGPSRRLTPEGRRLAPLGKLVRLGNFPTGGALTPDGRFYWTVSTGRNQDIRIVSVRNARVIQVLAIPGASGGIVMDPVRARVFVSGVAAARTGDNGAAGREADRVRIFSYSRISGRARAAGVLPVPPPSFAIPPSPPTEPARERIAWPARLAVSPGGERLLVPLNLAAAAAVVDLRTRRVRYVRTGRFPNAAAILPGGRIGLVSNETPGTLSVIDLRSARRVREIRVGPHLSHPEGIAIDGLGRRAYVAIANSDQVAVIDLRRRRVERTLSVERAGRGRTSPVDVALTPDGRRLLVAEAGADELAVFSLPQPGAKARRGDFRLRGRIPVASYPTDVELGSCVPARRGCVSLLWIAAKGLGTGANPFGPSPYRTDPRRLDQYIPNIVVGRAGVARMPGDARLRALTARATRQLTPSNREKAPAGTPLRAGGPIKHVFYVVRENRSYDQVLGDDLRGDGDPNLTLFGAQITPNAHALVRRFPLLDHVYANSESSADGHQWTSAGAVSDYVQRNWFQYSSLRGRPRDWGRYAVSWPTNGYLFDQAERQGVSYFNYGEALAGTDDRVADDRDRTAADTARVRRKASKSDLGPPAGCFPDDTSISLDVVTGRPVFDSSPPPGAAPDAESRMDCFRLRFTAQLATGTVPALNYVTLPADHTSGLAAGARSPRAMVAENDWALGQLVDLISHSPIWPNSAIFVIEDDSQNGADHVDAHRIPALVISPYAKTAAIVHTRYDFLSIIRSIELILGLRPLGVTDALATPMYDAFERAPTNVPPYIATVPAYDMLETNPINAATLRAARVMGDDDLDAVPQHLLDRMLWRSVHGQRSQPPPPGPNAEPGE